jgi:ribosomal protein RSM22 (predicted rRNA methylase)
MLHSDARRLFVQESPDSIRGKAEAEQIWQTEYELKKYKSLKQANRHAVRDGTAFASIALPAHYAAIYSVLDHVKRRLETGWKVERVIDWGTGTGSGLW